jgi:hypothetical protein
VAEDKGAHPVGREGAGLPGGEVTVLRGEIGVVITERRFGHQQVDTVGKGLRAGAHRGIHHEGEALAGPGDADVVQLHSVEAPDAEQAADVGPRDSGGCQAVGEKGAAVRLHEPVAVGLDAVPERLYLQAFSNRTGAPVGVEPQVRAWGGEGKECADHLVPGGGIVQMDGVRHAVKGQA